MRQEAHHSAEIKICIIVLLIKNKYHGIPSRNGNPNKKKRTYNTTS